MSQTYIALIVSLLATFLPVFGIQLPSEQLTATVQTIVIIFSAIWIAIRRYKQGGITVMGFRK